MKQGIKIPNQKICEVGTLKKGMCFLFEGKPFQVLRKSRKKAGETISLVQCLCECKNGQKTRLSGNVEVYRIPLPLYESIIYKQDAGNP